MAPRNTVPVEVDASGPKRVRIARSDKMGPSFGSAGSSYTVFDLPFQAPSTVVPPRRRVRHGTTPRSLGRTPSRTGLLDAAQYLLEVELHFPNLAPLTGRAIQAVPRQSGREICRGSVPRLVGLVKALPRQCSSMPRA